MMSKPGMTFGGLNVSASIWKSMLENKDLETQLNSAVKSFDRIHNLYCCKQEKRRKSAACMSMKATGWSSSEHSRIIASMFVIPIPFSEFAIKWLSLHTQQVVTARSPNTNHFIRECTEKETSSPQKSVGLFLTVSQEAATDSPPHSKSH